MSIIFIILSCSSCIFNKNTYTEEILKREKSIVSLNKDSIFWSNNVTCLFGHEGNVYFSDYMSTKIIVIDDLMEYKMSFGQKGKGPGEILGIVSIYVKDSIIYALDDGKRVIHLFCKDKYLKQLPLPQGFSPSLWSRFFVKDSLVYFPSLSNTPIVCFDYSSTIRNNIGEFVSNIDNATRILISNKSHFFSIGVAIPVFEKYSFDNSKIEEYDITQIHTVKEKINMLKNIRPTDSNSFYTLVNDAYCDDNNVYLLIFDNLLCFDVDDKIELKQIYKLEHPYYRSISVDRNRLFLFDPLNACIDMCYL